jgi:hypothetical protein
MRSATTTDATGAHDHGVSIALAAVSCALVIAACGSSGRSSSAAATSGNPQGVKYADCMRSHGVQSLPDPSPNGGIDLPSSINPQAPAFRSAQQTCANLQPGAGGPPPAISPAQQKSFVANAKCMRKHGIPNFPDPTFGPGGRGIGYPPGLRFRASAINLANKACAHVGTPLPLGGLAQ